MDTFEKIIQYAIQHEETEADFYRRMAEKAEGNDLKNVMLEHAAQEEDHKSKLLEILARGRMPNKPRIPDPDLRIADYHMLPSPLEETVPLSYQDLLLIAAQREQAAERLYQDLAMKCLDPEVQEIFSFLAEQESKHRHVLESQYDQEILDEG